MAYFCSRISSIKPSSHGKTYEVTAFGKDMCGNSPWLYSIIVNTVVTDSHLFHRLLFVYSVLLKIICCRQNRYPVISPLWSILFLPILTTCSIHNFLQTGFNSNFL